MNRTAMLALLRRFSGPQAARDALLRRFSRCHMSPARAVPALALALLLSLSLTACGASTHGAGPSTAAPRRLQPASADFTLLAQAPGAIAESRAAGASWARLSPGSVATGLTHLRARRGPVVFGIGPIDTPAAKLWLQSGAELMLSERPDGTLTLTPLRGLVRFSGFQDWLTVQTAAGRPLTGRDALLDRQDGRERLRGTANHLQAALWSARLGEQEPAGVGSLEVRAGLSGHATAFLDLVRLSVRAVPAGDVAEVQVTHVFSNQSTERLEGTFRFPLPDGAIPIGLAMEIDGRMMEGELVERQKARRTYEAIVDQMRDPALLEWTHGNHFKLRVFPIEPGQDKRIVLRYLAPLRAGRIFRYQTAAVATQTRIGHFRLEVAGKVIVDAADYRPGEPLEVPIAPADPAPQVFAETVDNETFVAARLTPDWPALLSGDAEAEPGANPIARRPARALILAVDTSRSTLESRGLIVQALDAILAELRPQDQIALVTGDLTPRRLPGGLQPATRAHLRAARAFLAQIPPDGASDTQALLVEATRLVAKAGLRPVQLVYLGDGVPTWGQTDPGAILAEVTSALGDGTPVFSVLLGRGASADLMGPLSGLTGGKLVRPTTPGALREFALFLGQSVARPRLVIDGVDTPSGVQVFPALPITLFPGDTLPVLAKLPAEDPPPALRFSGRLAGEPWTGQLRLSKRRAAAHVAQRFVSRALREMEAQAGAKAVAAKAEIVALSRKFGVMSRYTAFLVLASDQAYRRWQIQRTRAHQAAPQDAPQVSGGDLESVRAQEASLQPNHIQPGDPEIRIPAPADASAVVVVFPFGETQIAHFEPALSAWTVRFLIAKDTPDGKYPVTIRITHANGQLQILTLSYTVDTAAPTVALSVHQTPRGLLLRAVQRAEPLGDNVRMILDAARVEVRLPDGQLIRLKRVERGRFERLWHPKMTVAGPIEVRVVATDAPGNRAVFVTTVGVQPGSRHARDNPPRAEVAP